MISGAAGQPAEPGSTAAKSSAKGSLRWTNAGKGRLKIKVEQRG
jgi:hypothetical protein